MAGLRGEFERQGQWLFRWRSYLPLALVPILLAALLTPSVFLRIGGPLAQVIWEAVCFAVCLSGLAVRIGTVGFVPGGTSGRNTKKGQVADTLNVTGLYSVVRHPLYVGNFLIVFGVALFPGVWWFALTVALAFWLYYERIMYAEEEYLRGKFGPAFEEWAARTPAFWPDLGHWRPPGLPFSLRTVLRRENPGLFGIIFSLTLLKIAMDFVAEGRLVIGTVWAGIFGGGLAVYVVLWLLKKQTRLLHVGGR